jgi:hypothetical protein
VRCLFQSWLLLAFAKPFHVWARVVFVLRKWPCLAYVMDSCADSGDRTWKQPKCSGRDVQLVTTVVPSSDDSFHRAERGGST